MSRRNRSRSSVVQWRENIGHPRGSARLVSERRKTTTKQEPNHWQTIVGIVEDVAQKGVSEGRHNSQYSPMSQSQVMPFISSVTFAMHTTRSAGELTPSLRAVVRELNPNLALRNIRAMDAVVVAASMTDSRFRNTVAHDICSARVVACGGWYVRCVGVRCCCENARAWRARCAWRGVERCGGCCCAENARAGVAGIGAGIDWRIGAYARVAEVIVRGDADGSGYVGGGEWRVVGGGVGGGAGAGEAGGKSGSDGGVAE